MKRKVNRFLNIVRGGIGIPIAPNTFLMRGRTHEQGGIDIGESEKNGLEVEGNEIVKVGSKDIKVLSAQPILNGQSPAMLALRGNSFDKIFNAQERFKRVNHLNDDGSKARLGKRKNIVAPSIDDMYNDYVASKVDTIEMTPKRAISFNKDGNNAFMAVTGDKDRFVYPEELQPSIITAKAPTLKEYNYAQGTKFGENIIDKTNKIAPYVGAGLGSTFLAASTLGNLPSLVGGMKYLSPGYWFARAGKPFIGLGADIADGTIGTVRGVKNTYNNIKDKNWLKAGVNALMTLMGAASSKNLLDIANSAYRAKHIYNNVAPFAYNHFYDRSKKALTGMLLHEDVDFVNPKWLSEDSDEMRLAFYNSDRLRRAAWLKYLGLPEIDNAYIPNGDGTFRFNFNNKYVSDLLKQSAETDIPWVSKGLSVRYNRISDPFGVHGGLGGVATIPIGLKTGPGSSYIGRIEDVWDLNPFKDRSILTSLGEKGMHLKYYDIINKIDDKLTKVIKNIEVGKILGGKPFTLKQDLPLVMTNSGNYFIPGPATKGFISPFANLSGEDFMKRAISDGGHIYHKLQFRLGGKKTYNGRHKALLGTLRTTPWGTTTYMPSLNDTLSQPLMYANAFNPGSIYDAIAKTKSASDTANTDKQSFWNTIKTNMGPADWLNLGTTAVNTIGNIASYAINNRMLNRLTYPQMPIQLSAEKMKTNFNINPQLDNVRNMINSNISDVAHNTASSRGYMQRAGLLRGSGLDYANQLYGAKENYETQLINQDKTNRQSVAAANLERYNAWDTKRHDFFNTIKDKKSENAITHLIQNPASDMARFADNYQKITKYDNDLLMSTIPYPEAFRLIFNPAMRNGAIDKNAWARLYGRGRIGYNLFE